VDDRVTVEKTKRYLRELPSGKGDWSAGVAENTPTKQSQQKGETRLLLPSETGKAKKRAIKRPKIIKRECLFAKTLRRGG